VRARNAQFHVGGLTELWVGHTPFCDVCAGSSPPAIMPRVADATRMTFFGFGMDDAKLF
jgi:hypothetical protein